MLYIVPLVKGNDNTEEKMIHVYNFTHELFQNIESSVSINIFAAFFNF